MGGEAARFRPGVHRADAVAPLSMTLGLGPPFRLSEFAELLM
jgi:hypothetical protein